MINLLPLKEQKTIYREYLLRVATLLLTFLGFLGVFFVVALIPSYMHLVNAIDSATQDHAAKVAQLTAADQDDVNAARAFVEQVGVLKESDGIFSVQSLITKIILLKSSGIIFTDFLFDQSPATPPSIQVRGKADTREELIALKTALEAEKQFSSVDLPVQTLIKSKDILFSLKIILNGSAATPQKAIPTPPPTPSPQVPPSPPENSDEGNLLP